MRRLTLLTLVFALAGGALAADPPPPPLSVRLVATEGGQPTPQVEGDDLALEAASLLGPGDIKSVSADGGAVRVDLTPAAAARFGEATKANIGRKMAIVVDGKILMAPVVREAITGGRLMITVQDAGAAAGLAARLQPPRDCLSVEPNYTLGKVRLGMTKDELARLGEVKDAGAGWETVAGYRVKMGLGEVSAVEHPLKAGMCLKVLGREVEGDVGPHVLAAALGGCGVEQNNEGGNVISCPAGARVLWGGDAGKGPVTLRVEREGHPRTVCEGYAVPGRYAATRNGRIEPTAEKPAALPLGGPVTVCVGDREISSSTRVDEVDRPGCTKQANRGATLVTCEGVRYIFAGPTLVLSQVEVLKAE